MAVDTRQAAARALYCENGYTQVQIAEFFKLSENTISKWAKRGAWKEAKVKHELFMDDSTAMVRDLILHQLQTLKRMKDEAKKEGRMLLLERGDIDALQKLYTTIKGSELKWSQFVQITTELTEYISRVDLPLAKQLTEHTKDFLNAKRKALQ